MMDRPPISPWIYIHGVLPTSPDFVNELSTELRKLIPVTAENNVHLEQIPNTNTTYFSGAQYSLADILKSTREMVQRKIGKKATTGDDAIQIFVDKLSPSDMADNIAKSLHFLAAQRGCNFVDVRLSLSDDSITYGAFPLKSFWQGSRLIMNCKVLKAVDAAQNLFKDLLSYFSVQEQLLLYTREALLPTSKEWSQFPDYAYCSLREAAKQPKSAKLIMVGLIATKPAVTRPGRVEWKVIDKSGTRNYVFDWIGERERATWSWVMALQIGQRKVLPRKQYADKNGRSGFIGLMDFPTQGLAKTWERFTKALTVSAEMTHAPRIGGHRDFRWKMGEGYQERKKRRKDIATMYEPLVEENANADEKDQIVWEDDASTIAGSVLKDKKALS